MFVYRKIPKVSPRVYIFQRPFLRVLYTEGNLLFKTDWASLQWGGNLPFLLCFTLYSWANSKYNPPPGGGGGAYFRRGDLTEGFCVTILGGFYLEGMMYGHAPLLMGIYNSYSGY